MLDRRQQTLQQVVAQERQKTRDHVRARFARFGDKPCARVLEAAAVPRGIQRLLENLGLPPTVNFEQQLDMLTRFMVDNGPRMFLQRMEAVDRKTKSSGTQNYQSDRVEGTTQGISAADTQPLEKRIPAAASPAAAAAAAAAQAETQTRADPTRGLTPPEWFDKAGIYVGPERRCGQERRVGRDRRDRVDSINKNTRFGGDRRKTPRRRDDRTRMHGSRSAMR